MNFSTLLFVLWFPVLWVTGVFAAQEQRSAETPGDDTRPWFQRCLVGMEVGPTGAQFGYSDTNDLRYAARFDGDEIVRRCLAAHAQYLVIWARDGDYAYYNSSVALKCPGLGPRDPLREAVDEARPHHLPVLAYSVVQQGGHFLKAHPEFEMRGPDGRPLGRFCLNSGYLEAMKQLLSEQLAYGIAGFHIDMLDQGFGPPYGCWCQACRSAFQAQFGHPMPAGVTWDQAWDHMLAFRYASGERFEKALAQHVKSLRPEATVDFNYHGNPPFSWEVGQRPVQHAGNGDFVTGETGVWGFSALTVGLNARWYRAATPELPVQVAMQRGVRMYHDQTTRPLTDMRWELLTLLAHGAFVTMVDKTAFDGSLDPVAYERCGALFKEAQDKRAHFGQPLWAEVGLYFNSRTRDWYGRDTPARAFLPFQGAQKALVYEHIPYAVVLDENVTLERLQAFPVVLLPNVAIISAKEAALFRRYVEAGGNLIVTGPTACFGWRGEAQRQSDLSELIGANLQSPLESTDNWIRFGPAPDSLQSLRGSIPPDWPFLMRGPAVVYEPTSAQSFGQLLKPSRTTRQLQGREGTDWPMSADVPVGPALLINRVGNGVVLTFAGSPDWATASEHAIVEARKLIRNAVRYLHPEPMVEISAPVNVEAVVSNDASNRVWRVHLLGYFAPPQTTPAKDRPYVLPGLLEDPPIYRATLRFRQPIRSVTAFSVATELKREAGAVAVTVSDVHEVIQVDY
jgi:Hypothetical glycosyl hydrolase 6